MDIFMVKNFQHFLAPAVEATHHPALACSILFGQGVKHLRANFSICLKVVFRYLIPQDGVAGKMQTVSMPLKFLLGENLDALGHMSIGFTFHNVSPYDKSCQGEACHALVCESTPARAPRSFRPGQASPIPMSFLFPSPVPPAPNTLQFVSHNPSLKSAIRNRITPSAARFRV